jgi:hypothetical protein
MHDATDHEFRTKAFYLLKQQTEAIMKLEVKVKELVEANNNAMILLREAHDRIEALEATPRYELGENCPPEVSAFMENLSDIVGDVVEKIEVKVTTLEDHVRAIDERSGPKSMRTYDVLEKVKQMEEERWKGLK